MSLHQDSATVSAARAHIDAITHSLFSGIDRHFDHRLAKPCRSEQSLRCDSAVPSTAAEAARTRMKPLNGTREERPADTRSPRRLVDYEIVNVACLRRRSFQFADSRLANT